MGTMSEHKLWANSGDSHLLEPPNLFDSLPEDVRERMPRSVRSEDGTIETIYVDGQEFTRELPRPGPGARAASPHGPRIRPKRS